VRRFHAGQPSLAGSAVELVRELQEFKLPPLRSGDALHLAMAKRQSLTIASADQGLTKAAEALGLPCQLIA